MLERLVRQFVTQNFRVKVYHCQNNLEMNPQEQFMVLISQLILEVHLQLQFQAETRLTTLKIRELQLSV